MPTDPNLILDVNQNPGIQPGTLISMFDFARQTQQYQRQEANRNALRQILSDPSSVDPTTGLPTTKAIGAVTRIDPETGLKLQDDVLESQVKLAQLKHTATEQGAAKWNFMTQAASVGVEAYDDAKKAGKSEADAMAAGQAARNAAVKNNGGIIGDDDADGIIGKPFDPAGARALARSNKEYVTSKHDEAIEDIAATNAGLVPPNAGAAPATASSGDPFSDFAAKLDKSENATGNPGAKNPLSSAAGNGQFIDSTWLQNVKAERPELAKAGLTDSQILALRSDPAFSAEMTEASAKKNAATLTDAGIPTTGANLAAAHKLGPADAQKVIAAAPDTPLTSLLSPQVIKANPQLAGQTAGQYMGSLTTQFGASPIGAAASPAPGGPLRGGKGWQILTDPENKGPDGKPVQYRYNPNTAVSTTLEGQPYTPHGAQKIGGGTSSFGRSAASAAVNKYIEENPQATAQDVANFAAQYQRTVTAGTADVKAEAAGLSNLGKMRSSVSQAEGNAKREADLVLSLADKGTVNGEPQLFNKWIQGARKGVFNGTDVTKFQTAVESFKNEYVKVLSTTGGMSGGMSSDAARREADAYINPNLTLDQIKGNIEVMKKSMANRTAAINQAYEENKDRVSTAGEGETAPHKPDAFVEGRVYRDAKGNKAKYVNGQFVEVQ